MSAKHARVDLPAALESCRLSRQAFTIEGIPGRGGIHEVLGADAEMLKIAGPLPSSEIFDFALQREANKEPGVK